MLFLELTTLLPRSCLITAQRKYDDAEQLFRRTLALLEQNEGLDHLLVVILRNLAVVLSSKV